MGCRMLSPTTLCLRRPRSPYVLKYLEGIPSPEGLIDHIAGANLSSSSTLDFFATVPRYINVRHEQRLSSLFFHHVLYPAGGARRPYQAVIVRQGRGVVPSLHKALRTTTPPSAKASSSSAAAAVGVPALSSAVAAAFRRDPLAVPESQMQTSSPATPGTTTASSSAGHSSMNGLSSSPQLLSSSSSSPSSSAMDDVTSLQWARADPARRSYFYAPHTSRDKEANGFHYEMGAPRLLAPHSPLARGYTDRGREGGGALPSASSPASSSSRASWMAQRRLEEEKIKSRQRAVTDGVLAPLCGVVQNFIVHGSDVDHSNCGGSNKKASDEDDAIRQRVERLLVNDHAGLLPVLPSSLANNSSSSSSSGGGDGAKYSADGTIDGKTVLSLLLKRAGEAALVLRHGYRHRTDDGAGEKREELKHDRTYTAQGHTYVQLRLPEQCIVRLPTSDCTSFSPSMNGADVAHVEVSRLAGGVEPVVSFAVGAPLQFPPWQCPTSNPSAGVEALRRGEGEGSRELPAYARHIVCLARLKLNATAAAAAVVMAPSKPTDASADTLEKESKGLAEGTINGKHGTAAPKRHEKKRGMTSSPSPAIATTEAAEESCEPWRLGVPLDPSVPLRSRTITEKGMIFSSPTGEAAAEPLLGFAEAETYLLPQRELLLTLHVPAATTECCRSQNAQRVQRQVKLGYAGAGLSAEASPSSYYHRAPSSRFESSDDGARVGGGAWPTDHRLTSSRIMQGRLGNTQAAEESMRHARMGSGRGGVPSSVGGSGGASRTFPSSSVSAAAPSTVTYEVRALPGDVVYIPSGWGYTIRRILGTAVIDGSSSSNLPGNVRSVLDSQQLGITTHKTYRTTFSSSLKSATAAGAASFSSSSSTQQQGLSSDNEKHLPMHVTVTDVEVDALCLLYKPYPVLSKAQADTYVSANYVHRGVKEFYEKGGNDTFHRYE